MVKFYFYRDYFAIKAMKTGGKKVDFELEQLAD